MRPMLFAAMCALVSTTVCSRAPQEAPTHSRASLLVEQSAAQPGAQIRIGIQLEMDKDWHIYWKNPGDSGEPPEIRWQLPEGVPTPALLWPAPMRLQTSAGTDFGYEGNAVLLSTLQIPAAARPGSHLEIAGEVRWLVCHDICVPQRAELNAVVRIAGDAVVDGRAKALLDAASQRIPRPLPAGFKVTAGSGCDRFTLTLVAPHGMTGSAEFFPMEPEQIDNGSGAGGQVDGGGRLRMELRKADHLQRDPARFKGLLVFDGQQGYEVDVPVGRGSRCVPAAPAAKELKP